MNEEILDLLNFNKDTILNRTCRVEDFMSREQIIKLLDYITNLQQENEELNNKIKEQNLLLIEFQDMEQKVDIYKSRCEKAIKYIKSTNCYEMRSGKTLLQKYLYELLNILNGSDENE